MAKKQQPKQKVEKKQEENAPVEILQERDNDQRISNKNNEVPVNMSGRRLMKQQMKRTMWFICVYAVIALIISAVLIVYTNIPQWLNMLVIVVIAGVFTCSFCGYVLSLTKRKRKSSSKIQRMIHFLNKGEK